MTAPRIDCVTPGSSHYGPLRGWCHPRFTDQESKAPDCEMVLRGGTGVGHFPKKPSICGKRSLALVAGGELLQWLHGDGAVVWGSQRLRRRRAGLN